MIAAGAALVASCSSEATMDEQEEVAVETVTYSLDADNSSLHWKGMMSPEYFHVGTVDVAEGSITTEDGTLTSGTFSVDMNSMVATSSEAFPEEKATYLVGHLQGTMPDEDHPVDMFFNTPKFPNVDVTLGAYTDGNLEVTLSIVGKELTQSVPVTLTSDESSAAINGTFNLDLTSLNLPGLQANPETGEGISPSVEFTLDLNLKK